MWCRRDRKKAMQDIAALTDAQFKQRFRMGRNPFAALLADIRHDLEVDEHMAEISSGGPVYPYLQLAICLRYLAGTMSLLLLLVTALQPAFNNRISS